jgi:putative oxygen-independent coproporphyrinogen III oxidase
VPGTLPDGEPVPADGSLPPSAAARYGQQPFGVYVHVPFCRTRCGYCDFNTYTATELGGGASQDAYPDLIAREIALANGVLPASKAPVSTVFFGGGTPTLLAPARLGGILAGIGETFGLAGDAEVTVEANPETVDAASLGELRAQGVTRVSFGMQSAVTHVLRTLDRQHQPGRPEQCVRWARAAGFDHISLDLIYGTPGESDDDWRRSLDAAIGAGPDHVSAYALIVEDGTRLAARVRRGEIAAPDDDALADRYLIADDLLGQAGFTWYEISNWAKTGDARCRHNLLVERAAPGGLRGAAGGERVTGRGPRGADPRRAADGRHHAPRPARRGPAADRPHHCRFPLFGTCGRYSPSRPVRLRGRQARADPAGPAARGRRDPRPDVM